MADQEKRKAAGALRLRKYIPVSVEEKLTFTLFRASVADISATGARLITSEFLSKGTRWVITMKETPHLTVNAEVRWVKMDQNPRPGANPQFQVGMQFLQMSADDTKRLSTYLEFEKARSEKI
ncbi:MAG: PilZ domain-containing protein [Candidatus Lustribacter sp.]